MTSKQVFEYALVELNKREAPSLLLEDYNYFINKAINQYINKMYNAYDINQQKSDDLRVLKATSVLTPVVNNDYNSAALFATVYEADLPDDYLHILNCVVEYEVKKNFKCYNQGSFWQQGAKRLTADMYSQIINNYYLRPTYKNPYFYINNVNINNTFPTSDTLSGNFTRDISYKIIINTSDFTAFSIISFVDRVGLSIIISCFGKRVNTIVDAFNSFEVLAANTDNIIIIPTNEVISINVNGPGLTLSEEDYNSGIPNRRYGNKSKVRMEIRYGKDNSVFELKKVYIDYLKAPKFIRLTQDQVDEVTDNSQLLEFPDYVCQEIVNELIRLLMENASDPRLQSHIPINQSIAVPGQEQPKK